MVTIERAVQSVKHFLTSKKPTCGLNIDTQTRVKHKGIRILWNEIFFSWFKPIVCFYHSCVNLHWHPNVLVGLRITEQYPQNPLNIYKKCCPSYCTACFSIMYRYCHSVILLGLTSFMGDLLIMLITVSVRIHSLYSCLDVYYTILNYCLVVFYRFAGKRRQKSWTQNEETLRRLIYLNVH